MCNFFIMNLCMLTLKCFYSKTLNGCIIICNCIICNFLNLLVWLSNIYYAVKWVYCQFSFLTTLHKRIHQQHNPTNVNKKYCIAFCASDKFTLQQFSHSMRVILKTPSLYAPHNSSFIPLPLVVDPLSPSLVLPWYVPASLWATCPFAVLIGTALVD